MTGPAATSAAAAERVVPQLALELRKAVDTRGAMAMLALPLVVGVVMLLAHAGWGGSAALGEMVPVGFVVPALGLMVTGLRTTAGEWRHGIKQTFAQNPQRLEVLGAKLGALVLLACLTWLAMGLVTVVVALARGAAVGGPEAIALLHAFWALQATAWFGAAMGAVTMSLSRAVILAVVLWSLGLLSPATTRAAHHWPSLPRLVQSLLHGVWSGLGWSVLTFVLWVGAPLLVAALGWLRRDLY